MQNIELMASALTAYQSAQTYQSTAAAGADTTFSKILRQAAKSGASSASAANATDADEAIAQAELEAANASGEAQLDAANESSGTGSDSMIKELMLLMLLSMLMNTSGSSSSFLGSSGSGSSDSMMGSMSGSSLAASALLTAFAKNGTDISSLAGSLDTSTLSSLAGLGGSYLDYSSFSASASAYDASDATQAQAINQTSAQTYSAATDASKLAAGNMLLNTNYSSGAANNTLNGSYGATSIAGMPSVTRSSAYIPEILAYTDTGKSSVNSTGVTPMGAVVPNAAYKATTPAVTSDESNRSADRYRAVIAQFDVENSYRYSVKTSSKGTSTYCNIFCWDVTSAMGAEIPHYIDSSTGAPMSYPNVEGATAMNANRTADWLANYGESYGWYEVTPEQAQLLANQGKPAITVWKNPTGGHGHLQVVSPSEDGLYDESRGVAIAQAGRRLRTYAYASNVYASAKGVKYYAHL